MTDRVDRLALLRGLPSIDRLLAASGLSGAQTARRGLAVDVARELLNEARATAGRASYVPDLARLSSLLTHALEQIMRTSLVTIINATGVVLHTNLGRALLSSEAVAAAATAATTYTTLEYDLEQGKRSSRYVHTRSLLRRLTGAENSIVVNNNAAAMLLLLSAVARGRDVIVSRGQLVEIGGGFRVPDILEQSGARLIEVGTTNRTYVHDYEGAIGEHTVALMRVHPSNFKMSGFTHEPALEELAILARSRGLLMVDDLGSGTLLDTSIYGLAHEPMVRESVAAGADAVCFSGDKLLGGPQAGILVGTSSIVSTIERHPLTRALRVDKMTLAALEATLRHYVAGTTVERIPVWRMLTAANEQLRLRVETWSAHLRDRGVVTMVVEGRSAIGGGSLPEETLPTTLLQIPSGDRSSTELARALRHTTPPVIARIVDDCVVCDPRTVLEEQDEALLGAIEQACRA